jgi:hypothetical protein
MDYGTSTNFPQQEKTSNYAKEKGSGRFAASYLQWHGHSLPRTGRFCFSWMLLQSMLCKYIQFNFHHIYQKLGDLKQIIDFHLDVLI